MFSKYLQQFFCDYIYHTALKFFANGQQENTDNYNADKDISLPGKLFLQEDTGEQQRNYANRGKNGGSNCVHTAKGIHVSELTGSFKYCGKQLIFVLGEGTKLNLLGLHEDE